MLYPYHPRVSSLAYHCVSFPSLHHREKPSHFLALSEPWLRIEAFKSALGRHMHAQHLEHISIGDVVGVVNNQAAVPYSRAEVMLLLEKMQDEGKLMIAGDLAYYVP